MNGDPETAAGAIAPAHQRQAEKHFAVSTGERLDRPATDPFAILAELRDMGWTVAFVDRWLDGQIRWRLIKPRPGGRSIACQGKTNLEALAACAHQACMLNIGGGVMFRAIRRLLDTFRRQGFDAGYRNGYADRLPMSDDPGYRAGYEAANRQRMSDHVRDRQNARRRAESKEDDE